MPSVAGERGILVTGSQAPKEHRVFGQLRKIAYGPFLGTQA